MQMAIQIILPVVLLSVIRLECKVHLGMVTNSNNSYPNQTEIRSKIIISEVLLIQYAAYQIQYKMRHQMYF